MNTYLVKCFQNIRILKALAQKIVYFESNYFLIYNIEDRRVQKMHFFEKKIGELY